MYPCILHVFVSNTYHSPCFNCISSRTVTPELCSHPRIFEIILGLCWAASTVLLSGVCDIFPPLLPQDGSVEHTLPFLVFFPIDLLRICGPETHFIYAKIIRFKGVTHGFCHHQRDENTQLFYHPRYHSRSCLGHCPDQQVSICISAQ